MLLILLIGAVTILRTNAVSIDNGVVGKPKMDCMADNITVTFKTQNPLLGRVYVKGASDDCSFHDFPRDSTIVQVGLPMSTCGMQRTRLLNPHGVSMSIVIIVQFHSVFITKVDRAYKLECFYAHRQTVVTSQLEVSNLTTGVLRHSSEMPTCSYTVTSMGSAVRFVAVGDPVTHRWECSGEAFGMLVHTCYASNEHGDDVLLVDDQGCSIDPYILGHLEYNDDMTVAMRETHAFNFADTNTMYFSCQIRMCHRGMGSCEGLTPPRCLPLRRRRRSIIRELTVDTPFSIADDDLNLDVHTAPLVVVEGEQFEGVSEALLTAESPRDLGVCLSRQVLYLLSSIACLALFMIMLAGRISTSNVIEEPTKSSTLGRSWRK